MAFRTDIGSLRKPERLPDGRLRADAHLTRTGVFEYRDASGGVRREYRPDAEVFSPTSLSTFADVPVTDDHPAVMVNAQNARQYQVGQLSGAPRRDGQHVAATLVVNDAATIAKMDAGKVQISCGYEVDVVETPGVAPDGSRYDAIQTNMRGNHVALVDVGRAGPTACVRMDSARDMISQGASVNPDELKAALAAATARADALQVKLDAAMAEGDDEGDDDENDKPAFLKKKVAKKDEQIKTLTAQVARIEADLLKARNDAADQKLRADAADKARTDAAVSSMSAARARISLESKAVTVLGTEFKTDGVADRDIMVAVVKKVDGYDLDAQASLEFVSGMYAGATRRHDAGAAAVAAVHVAIAPTRADAGAVPDEAAAARKMREDSDNAWKTKENAR